MNYRPAAVYVGFDDDAPPQSAVSAAGVRACRPSHCSRRNSEGQIKEDTVTASVQSMQ